MKTKFLIAALIIVSVASCKKDDDDQAKPSSTPPPSGNTQNGNIPNEALGKWLHGTFSMSNYYGYDGSFQGTPFTQSVAFDFKANGDYEMFYAGQTNNWGCYTDALSNFKGYAKFNDSTFTVYPQQGTFRGYYSCSPQYNFNRPAAASELKIQTFYYHFETDSAGKDWMVIGFVPNDPYPSYFASTTW